MYNALTIPLSTSLIGHGSDESKAIAVLQATNKRFHTAFTDKDEQLLVR
jgi:hypothetical protein